MEWLDFYNTYVVGGIQVLIGFLFFTKSLRKDLSICSLKYTALSALFTILSLIVLSLVSYDVWGLVAYILLLVAAGIFVYQADGFTVMLLAVVTAEILQLNFGVVNDISGVLHEGIVSENGGMFLSVVLSAAALVSSVFCYYMAYKYFLPCETEKSRYALMILTPTLMILLVGEYVSFAFYGNVTQVGSDGDRGSIGYSQMLAVHFLGIASLCSVLYAYKKLSEQFRLETRLSLVEQEEHLLRQYVDEAKARYENTVSFRHDIKNHMTVVGELLQEEKLEEALHYLGDMELLTAEMSFPSKTNHPVADILLGNKLGLAQNEGVKVSCSLRLPYPCPIAEIDFAIILSNALDNAMHACRKMEEGVEKFIRVKGNVQGDFILLEVENSFAGDRSFLPGTGLANMKAVAEKYHGALDFKAEDFVFHLSVLLVIPQTQ